MTGAHGRRLNVGIIGCGRVAQLVHIPLLSERPDLFALTHVCDRDARALDMVQQRWPGLRVHRSAQSLVAEDLDAVVIATSGDHVDEVALVAAAGLPMVVEKPLSFTTTQADRISAVIEASRSRLLVGYMKRYDPAVTVVREQLSFPSDIRSVQCDLWVGDDSLISRPQGFESRHGSDDAALAEFRRCLDRESATIGLSGPQRNTYFFLLTTAVHNLNLLKSLLGLPEEIISCGVWNDGWSGALAMRFQRDIVGVFNWSFTAPAAVRDTITFLTVGGAVTLDYASPYRRDFPTRILSSVLGPDEQLTTSVVTPSYRKHYRLEHEHLYQVAIGLEEPRTPVADAREDIEIAGWIASKASAVVNSTERPR